MNAPERTLSPAPVPTPTSALPGFDYIPAKSYQLSARVLYSHKDPNGVAFAIHLLYTVLGHRRGGTPIADTLLAAFLGVSPDTVRNARRVLIDCDVLDERRVGRQTWRRTRRAVEFVTITGITARAVLSKVLDALEFRVLGCLVDKRAEYGDQAGCGLTLSELADNRDGHRGLGIRPARISATIKSLATKGFAHVQTRVGVGMVVIPKFAQAVRRRISATARYALERRRLDWGLPRPGYPQGVASAGKAAPATPASRSGLPPASHSGLPGSQGAVSAQVNTHIPRSSLERWGFNDVAGAPWDRTAAHNVAPPPPPPGPLDTGGPPRGPKSPALDWKKFRVRVTA